LNNQKKSNSVSSKKNESFADQQDWADIVSYSPNPQNKRVKIQTENNEYYLQSENFPLRKSNSVVSDDNRAKKRNKKLQSLIVSSLALTDEKEGLICSSGHFMLFRIKKTHTTQAEVFKVISNRKKFAFYTGSVALCKQNAYLVHDNSSRSISRIYRTQNQEYVCETLIQNLQPVAILTSSL
jgi:hypothetical protein